MTLCYLVRAFIYISSISPHLILMTQMLFVLYKGGGYIPNEAEQRKFHSQ